MDIITLLLLAVALGTDAFSFSVGIGMAGISFKQTLIISLTVLIFHIFMPVAGFVAGEVFGSFLGRFAIIIGALILIYLGIKMILGNIKGKTMDEGQFVVCNTKGLILLAGSVSMDALSVGFTLGTRQVNVGLVAGIIGIVAGLMTFAGLVFGKKISGFIGQNSQLLGGFILIGIGIKMFF